MNRHTHISRFLSGMLALVLIVAFGTGTFHSHVAAAVKSDTIAVSDKTGFIDAASIADSTSDVERQSENLNPDADCAVCSALRHVMTGESYSWLRHPLSGTPRYSTFDAMEHASLRFGQHRPPISISE